MNSGYFEYVFSGSSKFQCTLVTLNMSLVEVLGSNELWLLCKEVDKPIVFFA